MEASRSEPVEYPINLAQQLHDPVRERKHTAPTHGTTRLWIRAAPQNTTHWLCSSFAQQFLPPSKYHKKKLLGSPDRAWHTTVGRVGCAAVEFEKCFTNKKKKRSVGAGCNKTKKNCVDKSRAEGGGDCCCCFFFFFYNNEKGARRKGCFSSPARRTRHSRQQRRTDGRTACGPGQKKNEPSERGRHQLSPLPFCPKKKVRIGCPNRNGRPFLSFPFFSFFFFRCVVFSFPSPTFLLLSSYGPTHFLSLGGSQLAPTRRSGSLSFACKFTNCIWQNG